jgi:hypothetical protein
VKRLLKDTTAFRDDPAIMAADNNGFGDVTLGESLPTLDRHPD